MSSFAHTIQYYLINNQFIYLVVYDSMIIWNNKDILILINNTKLCHI